MVDTHCVRLDPRTVILHLGFFTAVLAGTVVQYWTLGITLPGFGACESAGNRVWL